jgi:hypothetical protein
MTPEEKAAFLEALSTFGSCELTANGRSMWPIIRPGDRLKIVARFGNPKTGSVAAVFVGNQLQVHRIVRCTSQIKPDAWTVRLAGDSSPGSFSRFEWGEIAGIVVSGDRSGKRFSAWFHPPLSQVAIALGYLLRMLVSIKQHHRTLL